MRATSKLLQSFQSMESVFNPMYTSNSDPENAIRWSPYHNERNRQQSEVHASQGLLEGVSQSLPLSVDPLLDNRETDHQGRIVGIRQEFPSRLQDRGLRNFRVSNNEASDENSKIDGHEQPSTEELDWDEESKGRFASVFHPA